MSSALVAASTEKGVAILTGLLDVCEYDTISAAASGAEARRFLTTGRYELVIVNAPLGDEFGHELAMMAAEDPLATAMLILKSELFEEIACRVENAGVLAIERPISRQIFQNALRLSNTAAVRVRKLLEENRRLQARLEEMRVIDRAKCVLIEKQRVTEDQAHHIIEKRAMDARRSKREIAEEILGMYR